MDCTATDGANLKASCSFEVTIQSREAVVGTLRAGVAAAPSLEQGERTSMTSQLNALLDKIAKGNHQAACAHVENFRRRVDRSLADGALTPAEGQGMIEAATDLRNTLPCEKR